jgi:hypothetical protein
MTLNNLLSANININKGQNNLQIHSFLCLAMSRKKEQGYILSTTALEMVVFQPNNVHRGGPKTEVG